MFHPKYRPDIDGLRAIAVLSVVAYHAFPSWLSGGFVGVDVFFVISGFLISTIIFERLDQDAFSFAGFYARRIRRIFPALLIVLIACFAIGRFVLLADEYQQLSKHIAAGAGFVSNFALWSEAGYFDSAAETKPLLHLWSLGIEEQFYLAWPLLLWLAWKCRFNLLIVTTVIAVVSFYLNVRGVRQDAVGTFYSPHTRFWELLAGGLLAWANIYKKGAYARITTRLDGPPGSDVLSVAGSFLLGYGFWRIYSQSSFPGEWALVPVSGAVLIIMAGPDAWINRNVLSHKIAVWFGLISYPLYLWHWPLLVFARIVESEALSATIRLVVVAISVLLAWLTYRFVEHGIRLGNSSRLKVSTLVVLMIVVGIASHRTSSGQEDELPPSAGLVSGHPPGELTDQACRNYLKNKSVLLSYCRFTDVGSRNTVAIIGDSHAFVAYPAIAEYLSRQGTNTVLLGAGACPAAQRFPIGSIDAQKDNCQVSVTGVLDEITIEHPDIQKVFLFSRGLIYWTGTEPVTKAVKVFPQTFTASDYIIGSQRTIDRLTNAGKSVFFVTENPELSYEVKSCRSRPLRSTARDCRPNRVDVLRRQGEYLEGVRQLSGAVILESLKAFCPASKCLVYNIDGMQLYWDDDHLTMSGSRFQVQFLLGEHLQ